MTADHHADIRLVVNADGFGSSPAVSRGVLRAHREGIVSSTSIAGTCPDPAAVKALLDEAPGLGVGVHLTLVDGVPVSPPSSIRSLVGPGGAFPARPSELFLSWAKGAMRADDVERELDAQVARLVAVGVRPDHLDTRFHIGFLPTVGRAVEAVARRHGIPGIRMAMEHPNIGWLVEAPRGLMAAALGSLAWMTRRQLGSLRHGPTTWGYIESGRLDEIRILEIIGRLGPGGHELICHPEDGRDGGEPPSRELRALTSPRVKQALVSRGIQLCRWSDLF